MEERHSIWRVAANVLNKGACTHTGFLPKSDPAPVVQFFKRTGRAAAGGQFGLERCTRKMFVHRNRKRNLLVLLYLTRKYKKRERQYWVHPVSADFPPCFRLLNFIFMNITGCIAQTGLALDGLN
jgi:hypothetical protein